MIRVQWREYKGHLKVPVPGEVRWEDGHDVESAAFKVQQLLNSEHTPVWIHVERTDVSFKGSSLERPKAKKGKSK